MTIRTLFPQLEQPAQQEEDAHKKMFKAAMRGRWAEVVRIYRDSPSARSAKLTSAEDTALHIAVAESDAHEVRELLAVLSNAGESRKGILSCQNKRKDTPLHVAARLGTVEVCHYLAEAWPKLITDARNHTGETPLFVAANHGKLEVFLVLQRAIDAHLEQLPETEEISYCRRSEDGDNILHRAIHGEYFELAFEIIHIYPKLVNLRNEKGESPLHLLAAKPSAFKSGSRIRFLDQLFYASIVVPPLRSKYSSYKGFKVQKVLKAQEHKSELSKNYRVCLDAKEILVHALKVIVVHFRSSRRENMTAKDDIKAGNLNSVELTVNGAEQEEPTFSEKSAHFPPNYGVCFSFLKVALKLMLIVLGIGVRRIERIRRKKHRHNHASQLMKELIDKASEWEYDKDGGQPPDQKSTMLSIISSEDSKLEKLKKKEPNKETPILLAAKMGIIEMVEKILDVFPIAIHDLDSDNKNIILLASEYRQPHIFKYMLQRQKDKMSIFGMVDNEGNSAVHLAARRPEKVQPWDIPGEALQMHWEIKWYKFIKDSMELNFYPPNNIHGESARMIFTDHHKPLVESASKWLTDTSTACSVVAALIATVAFTSAATVPGGVRQDDGFPVLEGTPAFAVFAVAALVALCLSVSSLVMFLSIITSRFQVTDFKRNIPVKLIGGLTGLFASIGAMLISFCGGHFYVIENKMKYAAYPIYGVVCVPVTLFALAQFPLYYDLVKATITHVPERSFRGRAI